MSVKAGIESFEQRGIDMLVKVLNQLHTRVATLPKRKET